MKGLLIKDFLYMKQQGRTLLVLLIFFAVFSVMSGKSELNAFIGGFITAVSLVLVINTLAFDEACKWDVYAFSLPLSRKQAVLEKYVFMLIVSACSLVLGGVLYSVSQRGINAEGLGVIFACAGACLIICSVLLPLTYKFGIQKAKLAFLAVVFLPMIIMPLVEKTKVKGPTDAEIKTLLLFAPLILIAFIIASYFISYGIVKKKEV